MDASRYYESPEGSHARAWIDDEYSAVMVKIVAGSDPVELPAESAREFGQGLSRLADLLDEYDASCRWANK